MSAAAATSVASPSLAGAPDSALELQVQGLMQRVAHYRDERCKQLRQAAAAQAQAMLRSARAEARARVREAASRERSRLERGARQAQARAELEARQRMQREIHTLIGKLWLELPPLLVTRWQHEAHRRAWIEAALSEAGALLPDRSWTIEHGAGWLESETLSAQAFAVEHGARGIDLKQDSRLAAGLRVRAGSVLIDATPSGLLARCEAVESAFLAEYVRE